MKVSPHTLSQARTFGLAVVISIGLFACSASEYSDLDRFMDGVRATPQGDITPIPIFKPYKVFRYNAASMRAPFEVPVKVREIAHLSMSSDIKPEEKRVKEQLESINFEALSMVGTLERRGQVWALVDDGTGAVHQVLAGNYLGKNHGRIALIAHDAVSIVEIISNGPDSWIERPRTLKLKEGS